MDYINMLLDVSDFFGEGNKRLKPILICLALICTPALFYFLYFMFLIPFKIFLPIFVIYSIRILMITIGEEKKRVFQYKNILYDAFATPLDLMNINYIDEDGKIIYTNGRIAYVIIAENGSYTNPLIRANHLESLIELLSREDDFDMYIQNITETSSLFRRYSSIENIHLKSAAMDYTASIDFALDKVKNESSTVRIIFILHGYDYDTKEILNNIELACRNPDASTFKIFIKANREQVEEILAHDLDTYVNFQELSLKKYNTGKYRGSEVIDYDIKEILKEERKNNLNFMRKEK